MARSNRRGKQRRDRDEQLEQLPFARLFNPFKPIEFVLEEDLEKIEQRAFQILEEIGMEFMHEEGLEVLKKCGADVKAGSQLVKLDRAMIKEYLKKAPSQFDMLARNPAHHVGFGANEVVVSLMASAPNSSDLVRGRRPGDYEAFLEFVKLGQTINACHMFGGYPVEPIDLPAATRHLDCTKTFIEYADKAIHAYSLGRGRVLDVIELVKLGYGLSEDEFSQAARLISIINTNSPLKLDGPMIEGMIELAPRNQIVVVTPFTLSGAMAPASLAGALAQQHAEAMAAIAFYQMIHPGAPAIYGSFTSNVDMKSGAPAFGTPEYFRTTLIGGQLARRLGLPFRTSNVNAANSVDAQATYESMFSIWALIMGGGNYIKHGMGWMEGGLVCSLEKIILDMDMFQMVRKSMEPLKFDDDSFGVDAIKEVGPGGHFFGAAHTLERYDTAFYAPLLSDWRNFENWQLADSPSTAQHAHKTAKQLLNAYQKPSIDQGRLEAMDAFIAKRKEEGGAPSY